MRKPPATHAAGDDEQDDHAHDAPSGTRIRMSPMLRATIVIELTGIRMAVTSGVSWPGEREADAGDVVDDRDGESRARSRVARGGRRREGQAACEHGRPGGRRHTPARGTPCRPTPRCRRRRRQRARVVQAVPSISTRCPVCSSFVTAASLSSGDWRKLHAITKERTPRRRQAGRGRPRAATCRSAESATRRRPRPRDGPSWDAAAVEGRGRPPAPRLTPTHRRRAVRPRPKRTSPIQ